jgi:hypothetical protein
VSEVIGVVARRRRWPVEQLNGVDPQRYFTDVLPRLVNS